MKFMKDQMHFLAQQMVMPFANAIISMNMMKTVQKHVQELPQKFKEITKAANAPEQMLDPNIKMILVQIVKIITMEINVKPCAMEPLLIKSVQNV